MHLVKILFNVFTEYTFLARLARLQVNYDTVLGLSLVHYIHISMASDLSNVVLENRQNFIDCSFIVV